MSPRSCRRTLAFVFGSSAALLLMPGLLRAQDAPAERTPPGKWVVTSTLGTGGANGGYGEFLEKPVNFDLNISKWAVP